MPIVKMNDSIYYELEASSVERILARKLIFVETSSKKSYVLDNQVDLRPAVPTYGMDKEAACG